MLDDDLVGVRWLERQWEHDETELFVLVVRLLKTHANDVDYDDGDDVDDWEWPVSPMMTMTMRHDYHGSNYYAVTNDAVVVVVVVVVVAAVD